MMKIILVKYKTLLNQQKQALQQLIQEKQVFHLSVIVLCKLKLILLILDLIMFFVVSNEEILFKLLVEHFLITDFQFLLMIQ